MDDRGRRFTVLGVGGIAITAALVFAFGRPGSTSEAKALPGWAEPAVASTADKLFESFKITATRRPPQVGEVFPDLKLRDVTGTTVRLRGRPSILIIGDTACSTCRRALEQLGHPSDVQVLELIAYGRLPDEPRDGARVVDARLEADKSNPEIRPSPGRLAEWIGLAQFIGVYLLDADGRVRYTATRGGFDAELARAVDRLRAGLSTESPTVSQPAPGQALSMPADPVKRRKLEEVLRSPSGRGVVIFTADGCSACSGLSEALKSKVQGWLKEGVGVAVVDSKAKADGELVPGVPVIADPDGRIADSWGRVGLPQAVLTDKGKYAGSTPFAELSLRRQPPGQPEETVTTKAPFTEAIEQGLSYIQERRGDTNAP